MTEAVLANTRQSFRLERRADGIAFLRFDLPGEKVNKLTASALGELDAVLKDVAQDSSIKALVFLSGKEDDATFIAGADVNEIRGITYPAEATAKAREAQEIFNRLAGLKVPVIAVVHGACLGGGTELILACDFRVATIHPRTSIGLPEVQLGIIPGFGGTQRLPRLIGIRRALELILTGKPVDARKAARIGLVDRLVSPSLLREQVLEFVREVLENGGKDYRPRRPRKTLSERVLEGSAPGRKLLRRLAARDLRKRVENEDNYPAPYRALEAVFDGFEQPLGAGLQRESDLVGRLVASSASKHLISIFLDSETLRRGPRVEREEREEHGAEDEPPQPEEREAGAAVPASVWAVAARRVGILGAGVMGGGIAALLARKGFHVRLKDIQGSALTTGLRHAYDSFGKLVKRRRMSANERDNALAAITATTEPTGFRQVEVVIEAVVEDMEVKKKVLQEIEPRMPATAVFATNTSSLSIDELARAAGHPERVAGLHFFNPVHRMPLVEVVQGAASSEETLRRLESLAREIGKYPLRVKNGPGFLVNRLLMPYLNEASYLFEEGYHMEAIDRRAREFGLPMGPFELIDEIGFDVAFKVAVYLHDKLGERMAPAKLLRDLAEAEKLLGKKGGAGFYLYKRGTKRKPNPRVLHYGGKGSQEDAPETWIRRMLYPMVNEAARCLDEGIVAASWQVDIGMIMGMGFPPFLGGPLRWADSVGVTHVVESLDKLADTHTGKGGERFKPCDYLRRLATEGKGFYEPSV